MRCYQRLLNISYKDHHNKEEVSQKDPSSHSPCYFSPLSEIPGSIELLENSLTYEGVQWRKIIECIGEYDGQETETKIVWPRLKVFRLSKTTLQGTVKRERRSGRQKKRWQDNIKEWTGMDFTS